ncbi:MAG: VOC family virulence protein [Actinomycetia bacterium]|nr:VOC family virulence protein [Actinomycetes bacterium]
MALSGSVSGIDHIVVNAPDPLVLVDWYVDKLGLRAERVEEFRRGEVFFPSVRIDDTTIIDVFPTERTGENLNHFCLVVEGGDVAAIAQDPDFEVVDGPDRRWGARGDGLSVYVLDPLGNTVELRSYEA